MRNLPFAAATMLTNDSYFMGNLYHLIIYSSKCAYNYEKGWLWILTLHMQEEEEVPSDCRLVLTVICRPVVPFGFVFGGTLNSTLPLPSRCSQLNVINVALWFTVDAQTSLNHSSSLMNGTSSPNVVSGSKRFLFCKLNVRGIESVMFLLVSLKVIHSYSW